MFLQILAHGNYLTVLTSAIEQNYASTVIQQVADLILEVVGILVDSCHPTRCDNWSFIDERVPDIDVPIKELAAGDAL